METKYFDDYIDFAEEIYDTFDKLKKINNNDTYKDISIIGKYEEIRNIIRELIAVGYEIHSIELHNPELEGYDDEYVCTVRVFDDEESEIWCEPIKIGDKYIYDKSLITYVFDNCSSAVLKYLTALVMYEVNVGEEVISEAEKADDQMNCETCHKRFCCEEYADKNEDDKSVKVPDKETSAVTTNESYKVNGKSVSKKEFEEALNKINSIEDKYLDNIKGMLLNYCEVLDEMNEWRKFLSW